MTLSTSTHAKSPATATPYVLLAAGLILSAALAAPAAYGQSTTSEPSTSGNSSGPQTAVPAPLPPGQADVPGGSAKNGVISPPATGTNKGGVIPPTTGSTMPVIPPPGTPQNQPNVQPK